MASEDPVRQAMLSAIPHLRAMLPTLTGEPGVLRTLKRLSNAQYEGFETVSRLEIPVRIGLDTAVRVTRQPVRDQGHFRRLLRADDYRWR